MSDDWRHQAACVGHDPEMWFPPPSTADKSRAAQMERDRRTKQARAICRSCPVIEQCAKDSVSAPDLVGIWAGMDDNERRAYDRAYRRKRRRMYHRVSVTLRQRHPQEWEELHATALESGLDADPYATRRTVYDRATSEAYAALCRRYPEQHAALRAELRNDELHSTRQLRESA